jgi:hypothetical protein
MYCSIITKTPLGNNQGTTSVMHCNSKLSELLGKKAYDNQRYEGIVNEGNNLTSPQQIINLSRELYSNIHAKLIIPDMPIYTTTNKSVISAVQQIFYFFNHSQLCLLILTISILKKELRYTLWAGKWLSVSPAWHFNGITPKHTRRPDNGRSSNHRPVKNQSSIKITS